MEVFVEPRIGDVFQSETWRGVVVSTKRRSQAFIVGVAWERSQGESSVTTLTYTLPHDPVTDPGREPATLIEHTGSVP